jgi:hypothetical protein
MLSGVREENMKNLIAIDDLETTVAPAGVGGPVIIEIIFVVIFLSESLTANNP